MSLIKSLLGSICNCTCLFQKIDIKQAPESGPVTIAIQSRNTGLGAPSGQAGSSDFSEIIPVGKPKGIDAVLEFEKSVMQMVADAANPQEKDARLKTAQALSMVFLKRVKDEIRDGVRKSLGCWLKRKLIKKVQLLNRAGSAAARIWLDLKAFHPSSLADASLRLKKREIKILKKLTKRGFSISDIVSKDNFAALDVKCQAAFIQMAKSKTDSHSCPCCKSGQDFPESTLWTASSQESPLFTDDSRSIELQLDTRIEENRLKRRDM